MLHNNQVIIMKQKLSVIAAALILATPSFTNAMEPAEQKGFFPWYVDNPRSDIPLPLPLHPVGFPFVKLTPPFLPNRHPMECRLAIETYLKIVFECTTKTLTRLRGVNRFTRDVIDRTQEEFVFKVVTDRKIALLLDVDDAPHHRIVGKLPQNSEELTTWCSKGYPCVEGERLHDEHRTSNNLYTLWFTTEQYSFKLFCYGIHNGCAPLVSYIMGHHNNFWERKHLFQELFFSLKEEKRKQHEGQKVDSYVYPLMDYFMKQDFVDIMDFAINNKELRKFFGIGIGAGQFTPFHSLAQYGSKAMIMRFLSEEKLVSLCLDPKNIKDRDGKYPTEIAIEGGRSQEIIDLLRMEIHFPKFFLLSHLSNRENDLISADIIFLIFRKIFLTSK